jgi:uncharacterized protein
MPADPVISVRGEATMEVEPEIAVVWVAVMARDGDRHRAVEQVTGRTARVGDMIKGFGDAIEKLESQPVVVQPLFKDGRPRGKVYAYAARAGFTVTVRDFAVLGELVTGLAEADLATVTGPDWQLRPGSPVYRTARLAAAADATRRAQEYAEAFGGRLTGLVEAADTGMMGDTGPPRFMAAARRAPVAAMADAAPEFDFEPAMQTVSAQVEARYTMTAPHFGN